MKTQKTQNSCLWKTTLTAVSTLALLACARGDSISYSQSIGPDEFSSFLLPQFQASYGTLQQVELKLTELSVSGTLELENWTDTASIVQLECQSHLSSFDAISFVVLGSDIWGHCTASGWVEANSSEVVPFQWHCDGYGGAFTSDSEKLSLFTGSGTVPIEVGLSYGYPRPNIVSATWSGTMTLTYDFVPVPEPGALALLLGGLTVLGARHLKCF
jgi:hypothetical protein